MVRPIARRLHTPASKLFNAAIVAPANNKPPHAIKNHALQLSCRKNAGPRSITCFRHCLKASRESIGEVIPGFDLNNSSAGRLKTVRIMPNPKNKASKIVAKTMIPKLEKLCSCCCDGKSIPSNGGKLLYLQ